MTYLISNSNESYGELKRLSEDRRKYRVQPSYLLNTTVRLRNRIHWMSDVC